MLKGLQLEPRARGRSVQPSTFDFQPLGISTRPRMTPASRHPSYGCSPVNAKLAACRVAATSPSLWLAETNAASNCEGGK